MALIKLPTFAKGELAPALHGRTDTAAYHAGLATARNVFVRATGGVSNRAGLTRIAPVGDHTRAVRLISFKFSTDDTYVLEFGHLYMRVIRNDAQVTETALNITAATQASPVVVTSAGHGYSNGNDVYISGVVGMTQLNGRWFKVAGVTANTFQLTDQLTGANIDGTAYTAYSSGGSVAKVYQITTPYVEGDLFRVKYVQSADVMTLTHPSYEARKLSRTAHNAWTLSILAFGPDQAGPIGANAVQNGAAGTTTYKYKVTAIATETLEESLSGLNTTTRNITGVTQANPAVVTSAGHGFANGDQVEINSITGMTELNGRRFTCANVAANTFELSGENSTSYTAYSASGTANRTHVEVTNGNATLSAANNISVTWTAATGANRYSVYKQKDGLYGLLAETELTSYTDDGDANPDMDFSPPNPREPFQGPNNRPAISSYFEQRQVYGATKNKPDTSFYSQTGAFTNMSVSSPGQPDDAITATLASLEVNEIRAFIPQNDLLVLTSGGEWRVNSSDEAGGFEAATIRQKPQSQWGSGHQRPAIVGNTVLYVQEHGRIVRSLGYALDIDGYTGTDMTILASHIFRDYGIVEIAYAPDEEPLVACVRSDGKCAVLTFQREQEVVAWAVWDTPGGKFESVTGVNPNTSAATGDALYFVVRRVTTGGTVFRTIERIHDRRFLDVRDCFFVDSGISLDSPKTISAVTLANPCVVTCTAHGFSNGDYIDIFDIEWVANTDSYGNETQPDQLNTRRYTVTASTANTFQLTDESGNVVNSSAYTAYVSGGTARAAVLTLSGLHHLEGKTVVALADGNVVENLTVSSGTITLSRRASRIHAGLRYIADVETLDIDDRTAGATVEGRLKDITEVSIKFDRSRGMWVGPDSTHLVEMKQRENEALGNPTNLLTGSKLVAVEPHWNVNGKMFLRQRYPLPMTILSLTLNPEIQDQ